jgi:hypothetical protein
MNTWEIVKSGQVLIPSKYLAVPGKKDIDNLLAKDKILFFWQYDYNQKICCIRRILSMDRPIERTKDNEIIFRNCLNDNPQVISFHIQSDLCLHLLKTWNRKDALLNIRSKYYIVRGICKKILDIKEKGIEFFYE